MPNCRAAIYRLFQKGHYREIGAKRPTPDLGDLFCDRIPFVSKIFELSAPIACLEVKQG